MEQFKLKQGQTVFQVGEQSSHVFVILNGSVAMYSPVDLMSPYARLKQGDVFGETGLIKNQLRCSKAVCLEECELVRINKHDFMRRLDGCDPLVKRLLETMVEQSLKSERSASQAGIAEAA